MIRKSIFLIVLLTILIVPIQFSKAEMTADESDNIEELQIENSSETEELMNEENNVEEDMNENSEDAPPVTDDNEESVPEESQSEEDNDLEESESESDSNDDEVNDDTPSEDFEDNESENIDESEESEDNIEESDTELEEEIDNEDEVDESEVINTSNDFSITQTSGSVYENMSLVVTQTSQTNDEVSLSLVFNGTLEINNGESYITFKLPDEIDVSKITSKSAGYVVSMEVEVLGVLERVLLEYTRGPSDFYPINEITINHDNNTISLLYKENRRSILEDILGSLLGPLVHLLDDILDGLLTLNTRNEVHTFYLDITLENSAFSREGEQPYTFQVSGTGEENPAFANTTDIAEYTITLDIPETGELGLSNVPETLRFQKTELGTGNYVSLKQQPDHVVNIKDTRHFNNNWRLTARSLSSFSSINDNSAPLRIGVLEGDGAFHSMDEAVMIAQSFDVPENENSINLNNLNDREIVVAVDDTSLLSGEPYTTTIEWTLTDAP